MKNQVCRFCITGKRWILAFGGLFCLFSPSGWAGPRIASINLCSDQYLLALADKTEIASVTALAADNRVSAEARRAQGLPINHGAAEEIVSETPDLVLADSFSNPGAVALIRSVGIPVVVLKNASDFNGIIANVRAVAKALNAPERGEILASKITAELRFAAGTDDAKPVVALLEPGGYTQGAGTLMDEAITRAGGINLARIWALKGYASLPLERLVSAPVDLIVEAAHSGPAPSLGTAALSHPALRARFADTPRLTIPGNLTDCPAPASTGLTVLLRRAIQALPSPGRE